MKTIEKDFIEKIRKIFETSGVAQLSDASNNIKHMNGTFQIKWLNPICTNDRICGPLFSVNTENDMLPCLQALAKVPPHYVLFLNNKSHESEALAGDIFVTDLINSKSNGLIVNGAIRDVSELKHMGLPVFAREVNYVSAKTALSKADGVPQEIMVDDFLIKPNDWVFGDRDGILIVKQEFVTALLYGIQVVEDREQQLKEELKKGIRLDAICGLTEFIEGTGKLKFEI